MNIHSNFSYKEAYQYFCQYYNDYYNWDIERLPTFNEFKYLIDNGFYDYLSKIVNVNEKLKYFESIEREIFRYYYCKMDTNKAKDLFYGLDILLRLNNAPL